MYIDYLVNVNDFDIVPMLYIFNLSMRTIKLLAVSLVEVQAERRLQELNEIVGRRYSELETGGMEEKIVLLEVVERRTEEILKNKEKWTKRILGLER